MGRHRADLNGNCHYKTNNHEHGKIGGRFTSHMTGHLFKHGAEQPCDLDITVESEDLVTMLEGDKKHEASISGLMFCEALSKQIILFSDGKFYVETSSNERLKFKTMVYECCLEWEGRTHFLKGICVSHQDTFLKGNASDSLSMAVVIKEGSDFEGPTVTAGKVDIKLIDLARNLAEIELSGCEEDEAAETEWKAKLGYFFGGVLIDISNSFSPTEFCPKADARARRPLTLKGVEPEVYYLSATDGVPLVMTRYRCGSKGPVLFLHGLCVSSRIFSLDTIDQSVVEYYCEHGYDMWVPELRFSVSLPSHKEPTHINDSAEHDLPPIMDLILERTGSSDVQVYAHCIGSLTMHVALFGGHVDKKLIRSMVVSQAGFCMKSAPLNHAKANLRLNQVATAFGFTGLNAYTDEDDHPREKVMSAIANVAARVMLNSENQCDNLTCHRITSMFGLMWEHRNMNDLTHDTLPEWFGFGHAEYYRHLAMTFRKGRLTDIDGHDVYIPDFDAKDRMGSVRYREAMGNLDIPILYYVGSLNNGWDIDSTRQSYIRCQEANPNQHYEWFQVPNYGHLDCVMGKNASSDVFPKILPFLEKYATSSQS